MRASILLALLVLTTGCPKKPELPAAVTTADLAAAPQLPSPQAGSYARVVQRPKDPVIRGAVGDRSWDASLAGAAAGLALPASQEVGGFTRREIREAAWQAGYPWPVLSLGAWPTNEAGAPPPGVGEWLAAQPADRDVGLVRARNRGKDLFVGLAGKPQIALPLIPRQVPLGYVLTLPARTGAILRTSDSNGVFREQPLSQARDVQLEVPGEWLIQIRDDEGDLARFTIYVDEEVPTTPVLPRLNVPLTGSDAARDRAMDLVQRARDEYGAPPVTWDPLLEQAAGALGPDEDPKNRAIGLAPSEDLAIGFRCSASSVEDCIDTVLWDPRYRRAFVDRTEWSGGLKVTWTSERVQIVGVFAGG